MTPELRAQAEAVYAEFISLPTDELGGIRRVPKELRQKIIDLALDVLNASEGTLREKTRAVLAMSTKRSA
jgi:hypothetical protein